MKSLAKKVVLGNTIGSAKTTKLLAIINKMFAPKETDLLTNTKKVNENGNG